MDGGRHRARIEPEVRGLDDAVLVDQIAAVRAGSIGAPEGIALVAIEVVYQHDHVIGEVEPGRTARPLFPAARLLSVAIGARIGLALVGAGVGPRWG